MLIKNRTALLFAFAITATGILLWLRLSQPDDIDARRFFTASLPEASESWGKELSNHFNSREGSEERARQLLREHRKKSLLGMSGTNGSIGGVNLDSAEGLLISTERIMYTWGYEIEGHQYHVWIQVKVPEWKVILVEHAGIPD